MTNQIFSGFKPEIFKFLGELEQNNNKSWFSDNRGRYEAEYLAPAMDFVDALYDAVAALDPPHKAVAKINGSLRRINRDVRFSKDKSPYHTRLHLVFWAGDHPNRSPGLHLIIDPENIGFGAGQWALNKEQLERFRNAISKPAPRAEFLLAIDKAKGVGCDLGQAELKRVPAGFETETDWSDLLKYKTIVCRTQTRIEVPKEMFTSAAAPYFINIFKELAPLNAWIAKYVNS